MTTELHLIPANDKMTLEDYANWGENCQRLNFSIEECETVLRISNNHGGTLFSQEQLDMFWHGYHNR